MFREAFKEKVWSKTQIYDCYSRSKLGEVLLGDQQWSRRPFHKAKWWKYFKCQHAARVSFKKNFSVISSIIRQGSLLIAWQFHILILKWDPFHLVWRNTIFLSPFPSTKKFLKDFATTYLKFGMNHFPSGCFQNGPRTLFLTMLHWDDIWHISSPVLPTRIAKDELVSDKTSLQSDPSVNPDWKKAR